MTDRLYRCSRIAGGGVYWPLPAILALVLTLVFAWPPLAMAQQPYEIGFLQFKKDVRYKKKAIFARYLGKPLGRPVSGAETAIKELRFHGKKLGIEFVLNHAVLRKPGQLADAFEGFKENGVDFVVTDLDSALLLEAGQLAANSGITLMNASASDSALRQEQCMKNIYHVTPSESMKADALTQYLASRKWRKILALVGPDQADREILEVFKRSAKRYGIKITDTREYALGNDPRVREKNNPKLLTQGSFDVIYVADSDGEFARQLPFNTVNPKPVVGAEGLAPLAWHWAWDRFGAPQLVKRFEKLHQRSMADHDWAAWMSIKIIAKAIQSTESTDKQKILAYFVDTDSVFDGFKGNRLNFRSWNNQLRQPLLLGTHNWVIDRAPITGFLHQTENLDTLGVDQKESTCAF